MALADPLTAWGDPGGEKDGCAFINGHAAPCGAILKPGSSYCSRHYALTHCARGSEAEAARLREFAAVARVAARAIGHGGVMRPLMGELEEMERRSDLLEIVSPRRADRSSTLPR